MVEKEDLGLTLSLNFPAAGNTNPSSLQLNLMPNWTGSCPSSSGIHTHTHTYIQKKVQIAIYIKC